MMQLLVASNVILWALVLVLATMLYALSRQIGVLHERIKPVGALTMGRSLSIGEDAPFFRKTSLTGGMVSIGGASTDGRSTLLFFMSATCPVCKVLLPILKVLASQESSWLKVVFSSDGHESEHRELINANTLHDYGYVLSTEVGMAYQVSKLPYAVIISPEGQIEAHGLVNNREHIESLFEATDSTKGVSENV